MQAIQQVEGRIGQVSPAKLLQALGFLSRTCSLLADRCPPPVDRQLQEEPDGLKHLQSHESHDGEANSSSNNNNNTAAMV